MQHKIFFHSISVLE